MPVYVYRCEQCGSQVEKRQSFSDAPLTECEKCHGSLRKVFSPAAIIYKGSGFYTTDYHAKSGGNGKNGGAEKAAEPAASDKAESKPASEPAEAAKPSSSPKE